MKVDPDVRPRPHAPSREVREAQEQRLLRTWDSPKGWRYWSDVNNNVVGLWYTSITFVFFLVGGLLALLMRMQLAVPDNQLVPVRTYDQLFTMHGSIMMFLFAVPVFEAVSIMLLPQLMGARDLPFPRLSAFGFWSFVLGGSFFCGTLLFGVAPSGGWFMYPPLTSAYQPGVGADVWLLALSFVEISAIAAAVELVVGVLKCRPPGMRIHLVPLYAWYVLVVAVMLLFAFPPLISGTLLLELERAFHWPFFDPARGGDPLLWQHLFWLFGHPEVYIVFLPSMALVATLLPAFTRVPVVGYPWVVLSAVGTGFLSFGLWVHHMFTTGLPSLSLALFSAASMAVAIPTGVQLACFVATLLVGKVALRVPLLFALGGIGVFVLGGLTGVMVALVPFDLQAHDSHFVVAHLHTVLLGGTVFPILGGIWYWYPLVTGKRLSERLGTVAFWLVVIGFCITFLPMHATGLLGMPRRVYTYPSGLGIDGLNLVSSVGAFVLALGVALIAIEVLRPKKNAPKAERNPWGAGTLEWLAEMPPDKPWGVRSIPEIDSRHPLWDQPDFVRDVDEGRFYLPDAEEGKRETLVTTPIDAKPVQCLRVAEPSFLPMLAAFGVGGFFILSTFKLYPLALVSATFGFAAIVTWLWIVDHLTGLLRMAVGTGARLEVRVGADTPPVRGSRGPLEQVVLNLVLNARDATGPGGEIVVETGHASVTAAEAGPEEKPGECALLSVSDTGTGIASHALERIFEPFFSTKPESKGTGLGLSVVHGVVRQHDGFIRVSSQIGRGTRFDVYLPASSGPVTAVAATFPEAARGGKEGILVVDDEHAVLRLATRTLQRAEYRVFAAAGANEALALFRERRSEIDLVLSDLVMPKVSGRELMQEIRKLGSDVPFLFSSGYSDGGVHRGFVLEEGIRLLTKPYQLDELKRKVREALDVS